MRLCNFTAPYYNYQTKKPDRFECDQEALEDKTTCMFHNEDFLNIDYPKRSAIVSSALNKRIEESITKNKPLVCIGYILPNVVIKRTFVQTVYFNDCKIQSAAIFRDTIFSAEAVFNKTTFSSSADFSSTNFKSKAMFIESQFLGRTYFFNSIFREADFTNTNFKELVEFSVKHEDSTLLVTKFDKNANFSKAVFSNKSIFAGCKFAESTQFEETTFNDKADFHQSEFGDCSEVSFVGSTFYKDCDFSDCKFLCATVDFMMVTFRSKAYFSPLTFANTSTVSFSGSNFFSWVFFTTVGFPSTSLFEGCIFHSVVNFSECTFSGNDLVDFSGCTFSMMANFLGAKFSSKVDFSYSKFSQEAQFSCTFEDVALFNNVTLEKPEEIVFDTKNMSQVSFLNTNISKVRFGDNTHWGGKDKFKVIEEEWFEKQIKAFHEDQVKVSLNGLLSVYRNLRESYEYRRRYDEAGKFFVKEMEIKRKYKPVNTKYDDYQFPFQLKNRLERNIFTLTGWYRILSEYGESLKRPFITGAIIVSIFTLFFIMQSNPYQEPFSDIINGANSTNMTKTSKFIGFDKIGDVSHDLKAFVRTLGDFLPILSMSNEIKIGLIDYVIKIFGGGVTFGLIIIALRRRFERKYYH